MKPFNDFSAFSARAYLEEFYPTLNPENEYLLRFYHEFYSGIPNQHTLLEIGGGPTIFQLLSASRIVDEIIFSEYSQSCRNEVNIFLHDDKTAWNWDTYIQFELGLENNGDSVEGMKQLLRSKIKRVIPCDVFNDNPLEPEKFKEFDILTMGGVIECISKTEEEVIRGFQNTFALLKPGGYFVGFFAKNFTRWTVNDQVFDIFPINESYVRNMFTKFGFHIIKISNSVPPDYHQDYEGIFAVSAIKK